MAGRTKKSVAQLNRDIREALAQPLVKSRSSARLHHIDRGPADSWDVAMDALLEQDSTRAADIAREIKRAHGVKTMTPAFANALGKVPKDVQDHFKRLTGLVSKQSYDWREFAEAAAKTFWEEAYRSEVENLPADAREALSYGDDAPDPPPAARALGKRFAKATREKVTDGELNEISSKFSVSDAGYKGAMQSMGHGVGWFDESVDVDPPRKDSRGSFEHDVKLSNAVWSAIKRKAREEGVDLDE